MEKNCETCVHFRRHYVKFGFRYNPVGSGHCVYPRLKLRRGNAPTCRYYREKPGS